MGVAAVWLLRASPVPVEDGLPRATTTVATTSPSASAGSSDAPGPASSPAAATTIAVLVVHVAGQVARPGVYQLPAGARVDDAVAAAGGALATADLDVVNLAAHVADGDRVFVPAVGETVPGVVGPSGASTGSASGSGTGAAGPVDLNAATAEQLDALPGIGPATAAAIVEHRERVGPFVTVDDLLDVPGIGPAKLDALRGLVVT
jgi:competence protein ComEA